jgi:outer membrane protein OmpA-like peptidoglycan-associated protein
MKLACCTLFVILSYALLAQDDELDTAGYVFEFDMKYTGSEARVDPNYQYVLDYLVELINETDSVEVHVRGHVCCGPAPRLSKRRARKAYRYLIRAGIDKNKVSYKGYSDEKPMRWPENTEEDELANRRVDFIIRKIK